MKPMHRSVYVKTIQKFQVPYTVNPLPQMFAFVWFQVFDSTGSFLSYINTSADPLYGPQGLALTSDGHVAVADSGNHCFKVYRYLQ